MQHELLELAADRIAQIEVSWRAEIGDDEFELEYASTFEWCASHTTHRPGDGRAFELRNTGSGDTVAFLELIDGKAGRQTKLLKMWLAPQFWSQDVDPEVRVKVIRVFADAYAAVILRGYAEGATEVKIYGRTHQMHELLVLIQQNWDPSATGWDAKMQGRWLAFEREQGTA